MQELINRAKELLADGTVARVLGWKAGDLPYNPEPAYFETEEELKDFVYNGFCGANLSKYMIEASKLDGKTMVCLKPCDTYSFNQLIKEHRVDRDKAYIVGVGCKGKLDIERIKKQGIKGIESIEGAEITDEAESLKIQTIYGEKTLAYADAMLERCHVCKGKDHMIFDEQIGESKDTKDAERFDEVAKIEAMSPEEKFAFFRKQFEDALCGDLNSSMAVTVLYDVLKADISDASKYALVQDFDQVLSLNLTTAYAAKEKENAVDEKLESYILSKIEERKAAKKEKNFAKADEIRQELLEQGIILEDTREGVKWKKA